MSELSCYTTALHRYLADEWDADALLAPSIRLAVATGADDQLAFSHHRSAIDRLPDGSVLRYAGAGSPDNLTGGLLAALSDQGRVIVQVDLAVLGWSPRWAGDATPHWIVVEGRDRDLWQVHDPFHADLIDGTQQPYRGAMTHEQLLTAVFSGDWTPAQRRRSVFVFGHPVAVPEQPALWLERSTARPEAPKPATEEWLGELDDVLALVEKLVADRPAELADIHDDLWAAGRHRMFALRYAHPPGSAREKAASYAVAMWAALSRATYFAVETARRGRGTRVSAVLTALRSIRDAEERLR